MRIITNKKCIVAILAMLILVCMLAVFVSTATVANASGGGNIELWTSSSWQPAEIKAGYYKIDFDTDWSYPEDDVDAGGQPQDGWKEGTATDYNFHWDQANSKLTLKDAEIEFGYTEHLRVRAGMNESLTIELIGDNIFTREGSEVGPGISSATTNSKIIFEGDGNLTVGYESYNFANAAILCGGDIEFNGSGTYKFYTAEDYTRSIDANGKITFTDGSYDIVHGSTEGYSAIKAGNGVDITGDTKISIRDTSTVTVDSGITAGIDATNKIELSGDGYIDIAVNGAGTALSNIAESSINGTIDGELTDKVLRITAPGPQFDPNNDGGVLTAKPDTDPTHTKGYTFAGWYDSEGNKLGDSEEGTAGVTYTAQWKSGDKFVRFKRLNVASFTKDEANAEEGWSYTHADKKLVLDSITIDYTGVDGAIVVVGGTTIELIGDSEISANSMMGISTNGSLTIDGKGSLTVEAKSVGIWMCNATSDDAVLEIKDGTIITKGTVVENNKYMSFGVYIEQKSGDSHSTLKVSGGSLTAIAETITGDPNSVLSAGIFLAGSDEDYVTKGDALMNVTGGKVVAKGNYAISTSVSDDTITVAEGAVCKMGAYDDSELTTDAILGSYGYVTDASDDESFAQQVSISFHTCVFDKQVAEDKYKATDATCTSKATYYYSCECGEKGTETFEYGEVLAHTDEDNDGKCDLCGNAMTTTSGGDNSDGLGAGAIIGIVAGSIVGLAIVAYILGYFFLYKKGKLDNMAIKVIYAWTDKFLQK